MDKYIFKKLFRIRKYFSCFLLAASFFAASFNFVQAAFVQQGSVVYAVNAPQDLTINGVTSGNSLIVVVGRTSSASRSYNVTSNLDGAFTLVADTTASIATFPQRIYVLHGTTAGNHTITISQVSNTNQPIQATVIEASGLDSAASPIDSSFVDGSATTTHYAAQSGLIDTTTGSFMVISGWLNGGNSGVTVGSGGFTLFPSLGNSAISAWLYKESSAGETDQRGEFANAGTPRSAYSAIAAFPYANDTISISGNVYSDEGVTSMSGTQTVRAKVNGLGDYTGTLSSGAYTISGVEVDAAGDVITVFLDGAAEDAVTVTRAASNSSNITGLDLYQDHVILRHEDAGPITNTNLDQYDNGADGDIPFTVTAGALNVSASTTLFILSGDSFTPGGDVTTPKMKSVGTFNAGSHNLNLTDSATPLSISGTFNAGTGTVNYTGSSATSIASTTYYNLGVATSSDVGAGVTYTLAGNTTVSNVLTVGNASSTNSDTLALSTYALGLAGSGTPLVITSKGALSGGTGTVNYTGSSATNVTAATYYDLGLGTTSDVGSAVTYSLAGNISANSITVGNASSTNSDTLTQGTHNITTTGSGTVITVTSKGVWSNISTGDIVLSGNVSNAGAIVLNSNNGTECVDGADDIVITSSVGATQRTWSGAGTFTIYNVSATDQAGTITAYTSTFSNTTWTVGDCGITISGTVYTDEGVTTMGAGRTVSIKINGAGTYSTTTDGSGAYSIPYITIASAGDVITAFLDGATEDAVTVSRALDATTDITGFNLYQNTVIVRHEDAGPITNTDLSQYDSSGDADIQYAVSLGSLTVSSGNKLIVWTGDTFTPGGVVITPKMLIDGTYVKEHNLSLTGIGTGSGRPLVVNGSITTSSINFYYLGDGDLEVEDVDGSYIYLNPTLTGSATYTLLGNDYFAMSAGPGSDSANTLTIEATSDISVLVILVSPTGSALATFDTGNGGYEIGVNSLLVGTGATYNANNSILALYGADNPFSVSGTFNAGTSTVYYINNSSAQNIAPVTYYNLVSQKGSSTNTLGGNVTVGNDLTITGGTLNLSTHNLTVSGDTSISGILDDSSTTGTNTFVGNVLINSGGSFFPSRNSNATIRGGITNDGTFNVGTGTWTFNTNNQEINGDNPLTFAGVISVDSGVNLTNNNSISMTATTTGSLAGAGTFTNGVNAAFNYTGSTVTINALDLSANRNTFTYNSTTTGQTVFATTYHNLIINKTGQTATLGGDTVVENNLTITNGTLTSNLEGNLDVRGDFVNNGTFNHNDGTVSFSGISKVSNISGETTFHNLSVNTPGKRVRFTNGETFVVEGELEILGEVGNPVILRSTLDSSRWFLDLEGTHNINHVNIKDSGCDVTSLEIDLSSKNAINSGNNGSCWVFGVAKVGGGNGNGGAIPGEESGSGPQESGGGQGGGGSEGGEGSGGGQQEGGGGSGGGSGGDLGLLTGWRVFAIYLSPNFGLLLN